MLPGKKYNPEDYLMMIWRRKWMAVAPLILAAVGTYMYAQWLPDRYRSETRILVVPQRVPESYVRSTITSTLQERLDSMTQQILSRTRLERILTEFDLYADERKEMLLEDVIARMRQDVRIQIEPARRRQDPGYFTVSFDSSNPRVAMQVADRLAALFIDENLQEREMLAGQTSQFLEVQLDEARRQLVEHEKKLEAFRRTYAGELPSQMQSNLQVMQSAQVQLQAVLESLNRDRDRQLVLDKMMADAQAVTVAPPPRANAQRSAEAASGEVQAEQLVAARAAFQAMQLRLTPQHPDVLRARRVVAELEKKAEQEALDIPLAGGPPPPQPLTSAELAQQKRLSEMQAEHESLERRIANARVQETRLQALINSYRARIAAAPSRESEQMQLTRDDETLKQTYTNLLAKSQESKISADLERRQIGEQFRIIDTARLPERPISPDRPRITLVGAVGGLAFGLALIVLFEYRDSSLRTHDDVMTVLSLPVLALVPQMVTAGERAARRRRTVMVALSTAGAFVVCTAAAVWWFGLLDRWVP